MKKPSIKTCSADNCDHCTIHAKTNCNFEISQLLKFYLISLPPFIIAGIFLYSYQVSVFFFWLFIIGLFFGVIEIRVLCSHCPHYERSTFFLNCWANYGAPKLWKYRPGPLNFLEKLILICGFILVWGYPLFFLFLIKNWAIFALYTLSIIVFYAILRTNNCNRCVNFSCPLNTVDTETKEKFLKNNPVIKKHWEKKPKN